MKIFAIVIFHILCSLSLCAISLEEIVNLHEAQVGEMVLLEVIEANEISFQLSTQQIIYLKKKGLSEKVIAALIKKAKKQKNETKEQQLPYGRELTSFDQFFLSTYYSHQYGWPAPNYQSPREILESGLFYQEPDVYPHTRFIRIHGYSYPNYFCRKHHLGLKKNCKCYGSLYSIIIPVPQKLGQRNYVTIEDFQKSSEILEQKHILGLDVESFLHHDNRSK